MNVVDPLTGQVERPLAPIPPDRLTVVAAELRRMAAAWREADRGAVLTRFGAALAHDEDLLSALVADTGRVAESVLERRIVAGLIERWVRQAPARLAGAFDDVGCVRPAAWLEAEVPVRDEQLSVCDAPSDQATCSLRAVAELGGRYAADQITIGVPAPDVVPYLDRRLRAAGLRMERLLDERGAWLEARLEPDTSGLYVPLRDLDPVVSLWRLLHDSAAAAGVPAHVTVLYPFVPPAAIDASVVERLRRLLARHAPFECTFSATGRFDHVVYLAPEPAAAFRRVTDTLHADWPMHPPYAGSHEEVIPHLTVADGAPEAELQRVEAALEPMLPLRAQARAVDLVVRRSGSWSRIASLPLGEPAHGASGRGVTG